jgi:flavin-dependent dehydrogenase
MTSSRKWDVAVLGGGPAGCAAALALRRKGIDRVCVVDPGHHRVSAVGETLPPDVRLVLDELGLWFGFIGEAHEACLGSCSSWGSDALGYNDFILSPHGNGWHLDRQRFDAFLSRSTDSCGAMAISGARFVDCECDRHDGFRLRLRARDDAESLITARFVVDATGSRSAFARRAGARRNFLDSLTFIYGFFDKTANHSVSQLTMLEAVEAGWWYAAGVPGQRVAVAFATDAGVARRDMLFREQRWLARLLRTRHIAPSLGGCRFLGNSLVIRAAPSFLLDPPAGAGWLAVGDAAATYDPLSSQGIHNALEDGIAAANTIAAAITNDTKATGNYAEALAARFTEYQTNRNYFYGLETRWPGSAFWERRHERTQLKWPIRPPPALGKQA